MIESLAALAGYATGTALLLALGLTTVWRGLGLPGLSKLGGFLMLAGLAATCWQHVQMATLAPGSPAPPAYGLVLFVQTLGFYWLVRGALQPTPTAPQWDALLAVGVLLVAWALPAAWRVPASMLLGTAFTLHICSLLWRLRALRRWFRLELPVLALFALMAAVVAVAGALTPEHLEWATFGLIYSSQIAIGFALVSMLLVAVPDIVEKTREAVATSYAQSTLGRVDVDSSIQRLQHLFDVEHVYRDESLSLTSLAGLVELSPHQLSELINQHFGLGFSRWVRRHRIAAAQRMLIDEPRASVLSVGLSVGFGSQSSFYVAFKDELGVVPGEFRRRHAARTSPE